MLDVDNFHKIYYDSSDRTWLNTYWMGVKVAKCPLDLWVYQEIVHESQPERIIETGTYYGGSALFLCHLCDIEGRGRVVTIDIEDWPHRPSHPRLQRVVANSVDAQLGTWLADFTRGKRTMVILDSDHRKAHVLRELNMYAPLVTEGCYLIVEDTNVNGHPVKWKEGPGPMEAVEEWLPGQPFERDEEREKFMLTFNPGGYLRRKEQ